MTELSKTVDLTELRARERVEGAYKKVADGAAKLDEKFRECRYGSVDNVVVIRSLVTQGMFYLVDRQTSTFWRSYSPDSSSRLTSCAPREVIDADRDWLIDVLKGITGGAECLRRYHPGAKPASGPAPVASAPPVSSGPSHALLGALAGVRPKTREERVTVVTRHGELVLQPAHLAAILNETKLPDLRVPADAGVSLRVDEAGFLVVSWKEEEWTE